MYSRATTQNIILFTVSIFISYIAVEAGYRFYWYFKLRSSLVQALYELSVSAGDEHTTGTFDAKLGYRYFPNRVWENLGYLRTRWRTNQYGLIANDIDRSDYPIEKPTGEYRIALLGDSLTAGNAVYVRWADLVQDYLNRSPGWRHFVGTKFTRVINFGMDGTGPVQWAPVYELEASRFSPDLVIVTIFTDDLTRDFVYRGRRKFASDLEMRAFIEAKVQTDLKRLPWFTLYPELIAATIGKKIGIRPRLQPTTAILSERFPSQQIGIERSLVSLERIVCAGPRVIVMHIPVYEELTSDDARRSPLRMLLKFFQPASGWTKLWTKFTAAAAARDISIVEPAQRYSVPKDRQALNALYNLPIDPHLSDYGMVIFASWVYRYLLEWSNVATPASRPGSCS